MEEQLTLSRYFWEKGLEYAKYNVNKSQLMGLRVFKEFYGVSPDVCAIAWSMIQDKKHISAQPKHLLWTLLFLKRYNTEHVNAALVEVDEKTLRQWIWRMIDFLANLDVVKWENRFKGTIESNMHVSLDGTDFRINEPTPFSVKWYSHKFKAAAVRYEIGVSIGAGDIVWASGGVPAGEWPDIKIAKELYIEYAKNEVTLADKGYKFKNFFKNPSNSKEKLYLARHETLNRRLKQFQVLNARYRHPLNKHPIVFHACVNLIQISINCGEKLFEIL